MRDGDSRSMRARRRVEEDVVAPQIPIRVGQKKNLGCKQQSLAYSRAADNFFVQRQNLADIILIHVA